MKVIKVNLEKRSYNILVGSNILGLAGKYISGLKLGTDAYVITNSFIKKTYGSILQNAFNRYGLSVKFRLVPDSEKSKSLKLATALVADIARYDAKRRLFVVAFGGGVVGDLAGFVASIYKRGIPYVQIPTTLLAQVDSAIGGKTAVDLACGKNLAGAFYQPRIVISDVALLKSLSDAQLASGLAEVIKYAVIKDKALFGYLEKASERIFARNLCALEFIVDRCSRIKSGIVSQDENEQKGVRTILNFGHTIGHAIEAAGRYTGYNHGQAVALGMLVACGISQRLGLLNAPTVRRIEKLIQQAGLPVEISATSLNSIVNAHYRDKKFTGAQNKFVLIRGIGKAVVRKGISLAVIRQAITGRI